MYQFALFCFVTLFFTACSVKQTSIEDLEKLPQSIDAYDVKLPQAKHSFFQKASEKYKKRFFAPWELKKISISKENATWANGYKKSKVYGMNHQRLTKEWFDEQINNANFEAFNQENRAAITIRNSNMRLFPTILPIFYNPKKAGEGFPFDYNQNSGIKINTPIFISHFSKDRAWVFVETAFAFGWLKTSHIAFVDEKIIQTFKQSRLYIALKDDFAATKNGIHIETIKLGTIFPKSTYGNFFVINHYHNLEGYIQTIQVPPKSLHPFPLTFSKTNVKQSIHELINEPYGWGESFYKRDCSALTKDFFALFGFYLNRNSSQQKHNGEYIDLSHLNNNQKKAYIKKHAKPFLTLIYLKGHIMIYAGTLEQEPLVFHNFWGIKTEDFFQKEGRFVVGKSSITTLEPGKELTHFNPSQSILEKIEGMVLLAPTP